MFTKAIHQYRAAASGTIYCAVNKLIIDHPRSGVVSVVSVCLVCIYIQR